MTLLLTACGLLTAKSRSISRPRHRSRKSPARRHDVSVSRSAAATVAVATRPTLRSRLRRSLTAEAGAELKFSHNSTLHVSIHIFMTSSSSGSDTITPSYRKQRPFSIASCPLLQQLHWLPIEARSTYKLCTLMHHDTALQYLAELCQVCPNNRL